MVEPELIDLLEGSADEGAKLGKDLAVVVS